MWFEHPSSFARPWMPGARAAVAVGIAAMMGTLPYPASSHSAVGSATPCVRISRNVAHYCGPASARLSVFRSALFRGGFCARKRVDGIGLLQVRIGARSLDGSRTNDGLPYFSLGITGSPSGAKSGNVIAYYRSRRWIGRIVSFRGNAHGGTFAAQGVGGSRGRATASFRC
jgi:hypothetical protein